MDTLTELHPGRYRVVGDEFRADIYSDAGKDCWRWTAVVPAQGRWIDSAGAFRTLEMARDNLAWKVGKEGT